MKSMQRLPLIACGMAIIACIGVIGVFGFQSRRIEELHREQADLMRRVSTTESVYDVQDCGIPILANNQGVKGCDLGQGSQLFLGEEDADGEVRSLIMIDASGTRMEIGRLPKEATYIRILEDYGPGQGFLSDKSTGSVEVYAARPSMKRDESDERLPIMIKHVPLP
jgi:hypothetical protein